ncbi:MAG: hypothetical protein ACI80H_001952 [Pseudoalteromonas distincta]|jgi:hypothetical protein
MRIIRIWTENLNLLYYSLRLPSSIGYGYQKPDGHLVFRTGITSPDGVYLALGTAV